MLWPNFVVRCCGYLRSMLPALLALLLTACGGSNGSSPSSPAQADPIAGVDANNNGVRDDVEKYIANTYADPAQKDTKAALMQYAKVLQSTIVNAAVVGSTPAASATSGATTETAARHLQEIVNAFQCLGARRPEDFPFLETDLRSVVLDTEARQQAYLRAAQLAEGAVKQMRFLDPTNWASVCS